MSSAKLHRLRDPDPGTLSLGPPEPMLCPLHPQSPRACGQLLPGGGWGLCLWDGLQFVVILCRHTPSWGERPPGTSVWLH